MGILGSLIITAIAYMAVPMIMMASNGGKFPKKKANKIALINSLVVGVLFLIITISLEATAGWSAAPAILYYGINFAIISEKSTKEKNNSENNEIQPSQKENFNETRPVTQTDKSANTQPIAKPKVEQTQRINFCRKCGNKLIDGSVFCNKCGTKINWN